MTGKSAVKPFVREVSRTTWYLARGRDRMHMAHESSCIFVGLYAVFLLCGLRALAAGPDVYQAFLASLTSPLAMVFHWVAFPVILFHTVSWFQVTPKAMPIQLGETFVPGPVIVIGHYVVWLALSLFILFMGGVLHG